MLPILLTFTQLSTKVTSCKTEDSAWTSKVSVEVRETQKLLFFKFSKKYHRQFFLNQNGCPKLAFPFRGEQFHFRQKQAFFEVAPERAQKQVFLVEKPYHDTSKRVKISQMSTFLKPHLRFPKKNDLVSNFTHTSRLKISNKSWIQKEYWDLPSLVEKRSWS